MTKNPSEQDERQVRVGMLEKLRAEGMNPYPARFDKTHSTAHVVRYAEQEKSSLRAADTVFAAPTKHFSVAGRVMAFREHGKIAFANIQDAEGQLQICFKEDVLGEKVYSHVLQFVNLGDFVGIKGEPFITKQGKLALLCAEFAFLGKTLRPLPDKFHGLADQEIKYRQRYLDLIANKDVLDRFMVRSKITQGIREWLLHHGFVEIVTRTLQAQAGGAIAKPFTTHHNALDTDFNLRIAPELDLKMAIVGGMERVFEFATNFRNEGIDPSHLQEFQELEWYAAYENFETGMKWTEELLKKVLPDALGQSTFTVYDKDDKPHEIDISKPWPHVKFGDLLKEKGVDMFADKKTLLKQAEKFGLRVDELAQRGRANILDEIYKKTIRPHLIQPMFLTHHPADLKPLARTTDEDPRIAESYQLLIAGWEVVNSYSELVNPLQQRKALEDQAKVKTGGDEEAMELNEEYLTAMEHGMPPITGFGMGIDRLVTLVTGQKNLRDVVLFPLMKSEDAVIAHSTPKTSKKPSLFKRIFKKS